MTWTAGLRFGRTLGSPLAFSIANRDWAELAGAHGGRADAGVAPAEAHHAGTARPRRPRRAPSSTTPTTSATSSSAPRPARRRPRVAAGAVCRQLLAAVPRAHLVVRRPARPGARLPRRGRARRRACRPTGSSSDRRAPSPLRCPDPMRGGEMIGRGRRGHRGRRLDRRLLRRRRRGHARGHRLQRRVGHAPRHGHRRGAHGHPGRQGRRDRPRLRRRRAGAAARSTTRSRPGARAGQRKTNRAGGIEGGMSNGAPIVVRVGRQAGLDAAQAARLGRPRDRRGAARPHRAQRRGHPAARRGRRRGHAGARAGRRAAGRPRRRHDRRPAGCGCADAGAGPPGRGASRRGASRTATRPTRGTPRGRRGRGDAGGRARTPDDRDGALDVPAPRPGHRLLGVAGHDDGRLRGARACRTATSSRTSRPRPCRPPSTALRSDDVRRRQRDRARTRPPSPRSSTSVSDLAP